MRKYVNFLRNIRKYKFAFAITCLWRCCILVHYSTFCSVSPRVIIINFSSSTYFPGNSDTLRRYRFRIFIGKTMFRSQRHKILSDLCNCMCVCVRYLRAHKIFSTLNVRISFQHLCARYYTLIYSFLILCAVAFVQGSNLKYHNNTVPYSRGKYYCVFKVMQPKIRYCVFYKMSSNLLRREE